MVTVEVVVSAPPDVDDTTRLKGSAPCDDGSSTFCIGGSFKRAARLFPISVAAAGDACLLR